MKIVADTHTHTLASGHAYSTIIENAHEASAKGIGAIAMTDHGPMMPGVSGLLHFRNLKAIPEYIYGVRIIKGAEVNITDYDGGLDIPDEVLSRLEFRIASLHDIIIRPGTSEENTSGVINALKNPYIDVVAHPGNPAFPVDIDKVVRTAAKYNKLIEINNSSFKTRRGCGANCLEFVKKCKQYGVRIACGSDAHICYDIGCFGRVLELLEEAEMPEELVIGPSILKIEEYLKERKASRPTIK